MSWEHRTKDVYATLPCALLSSSKSLVHHHVQLLAQVSLAEQLHECSWCSG